MVDRLIDEALLRLDRAVGIEAMVAALSQTITVCGAKDFVASAWETTDPSRILLYSSHTPLFGQLDSQSAWWSDDPILARLANGETLPFSHSEAWKRPLSSARPPWQAMEEAGLDSGIVFPTSRAPYCGGVLVFTPSGDEAVLQPHLRGLHLVCTYFHAAIVSASLAEEDRNIIRNTLQAANGERKYKLSDREIGCLR